MEIDDDEPLLVGIWLCRKKELHSSICLKAIQFRDLWICRALIECALNNFLITNFTAGTHSNSM